MELTSLCQPRPEQASGYSVLLAERVLALADSLNLPQQWHALHLGHPSRRCTAYPSEQRIAALLAGLATGLPGIAAGNFWLRPNTALCARLGGRFPDQGTLHRWLAQTTLEQAADLRSHLHHVAAEHGRFWQEMTSPELLVIDIDGQGLVARGQRFERARTGYLGEGLDRGFLRYVCYVGATAEVLDELLLPGNTTLMSVLPQMVQGLDEVLPRRRCRKRVLLRADSHAGTAANLACMREHGYHYLCPLYSCWSKNKLKKRLQGKHSHWFMHIDSKGQERHIECWELRRWQLASKGGRFRVRPRALVYREIDAEGDEHWQILLTDVKGRSPAWWWQHYQQRGGTIEEYNDQTERAYHLEVMRTGNYAGLQAVHSLVALCWNLTRWATEGLLLPPLLSPQAAEVSWVRAETLSLSQLVERASHSGLRLYRGGVGEPLEVEDTLDSGESRAWIRCLQQPVQLRLRLTG